MLSVVTLGVGLAACPSRSGEVQRAFSYLSFGVLFCVVISLAWHIKLATPIPRLSKLAMAIPLLVGFWSLLVLFRREAVREYNLRSQMTNNVKNLSLAFHAFDNANKHIPANILNADGNALLSWRVSILPWIDQSPLQTELDLTQPWDSPRNRPVFARMPSTYFSLLFPQEPGTTPWQGFVGPGTAFDPAIPNMSLKRDFPDGTANTILVVEAADHVPWTKPVDIPYGPNIPLPQLGGDYCSRAYWPFQCERRNPGSHVAFADGTVRFLQSDTSEEILRSLIVRNDGGPNDGWYRDE